MVAALATAQAAEMTEAQRELLAALRKNAPDAVVAAVEAGADPNFAYDGELTPLAMASLRGSVPLIKALIVSGADPDLPCKVGTPLMAAITGGHKAAVRALIAVGANLNREYEGNTALDFARLLGKQAIAELISKHGGKASAGAAADDRAKRDDEERRRRELEQAKKYPLLRDKATVPPGNYRLPCKIVDPPPRDASCDATGVEQLEYAVVSPVVKRTPGCVADLGPGNYRIAVHTQSVPWTWQCKHKLRTTTGEASYIATLDKRPNPPKTRVFDVRVKKGARLPKQDPPEPPPRVTIVKPSKQEQFSFDEAGALTIDVEARVENCGGPVWSMTDVGAEKATVNPQGADKATLEVAALPARNRHFGTKTITAEACGAKDTVEIQIFFPPTATNHGGDGKGTTPNWFHYWKQTSAAQGHAGVLDYTPSLGPDVLGRHDDQTHRVTLTDNVQTSADCTQRPGTDASGIDCFGEVVRHEWQHEVDWQTWWPSGYWILLDMDLDKVPFRVEERNGCSFGERGCPVCIIPRGRGCRPFERVTDAEINAYDVGWDWRLGTANGEDWSRCGKQWQRSAGDGC